MKASVCCGVESLVKACSNVFAADAIVTGVNSVGVAFVGQVILSLWSVSIVSRKIIARLVLCTALRDELISSSILAVNQSAAVVWLSV